MVNDLDPAPAEETVEDIKAAGGKAVACVGSVTEDGFAERFVNTAIEIFGGLDIIVNNAGYTWDSVIQKMTDEQWDAILDVHLKAPFQILRAAQPHISAWQGGSRRELPPQGRQHLLRRRRQRQRRTGQLLLRQGGHHRPDQDPRQGVGPLQRQRQRRRLRPDPHPPDRGAGRRRAPRIDIEGRELPVGVNPQLLSALEKGIPLGRAGTPEEAAGAVFTLCMPEADYVSGQVINCSGGY